MLHMYNHFSAMSLLKSQDQRSLCRCLESGSFQRVRDVYDPVGAAAQSPSCPVVNLAVNMFNCIARCLCSGILRQTEDETFYSNRLCDGATLGAASCLLPVDYGNSPVGAKLSSCWRTPAQVRGQSVGRSPLPAELLGSEGA